MAHEIRQGNGDRPGATWNRKGINFALYSENATKVELCLFKQAQDTTPAEVFELPGKTHHIFHGFIPHLLPGQLYGYRVYGPYEPGKGQRFNPHKLLVDPYAKAITGELQWNKAVFGYTRRLNTRVTGFSKTDSTPFVPKSVVIDPSFNWEGDRPLRIPTRESIVYELHVKGYTKLQQKLPEDCRGVFNGLSHPVTIAYLREMGITAVELMPVHFFISERELVEKKLTNYWGYNSIGFFAPYEPYAQSKGAGAVNEFKQMVKALHKAGIEVILDVVFNHSGEGNATGPTVTFRGIDNAIYYRLKKDRPEFYEDSTGTGNTLNTQLPGVLQLIMDALRYWIADMHVDGFRFDLAPALARDKQQVEQLSSFFNIICQDPVLSQVKLIAEPWDIGTEGYQVGNFPAGWSEWNDKYRNGVRNYWRCKQNAGEFAQRFMGSRDVYMEKKRQPCANINFITAHDGFTLHDLVTYKKPDNSLNKSNGTDGSKNNHSVNWGVEGETTDKHILWMRCLHKRNLLASLFLSQGTPMLYAGDEICNTQRGNNNAFCQDNELAWIKWHHADHAHAMFTRRIIQLRKQHPVFHRASWFLEAKGEGQALPDIAWFLRNGKRVTSKQLQNLPAQPLGVFLNGDYSCYKDDKGNEVRDNSFFIIFNNTTAPLTFSLPPVPYGKEWIKLLDTAEMIPDHSCNDKLSGKTTVAAFSTTVLQKL